MGFEVVDFGSVKCTDCGRKGNVMRLSDYERDRNRDDPDWYWEPYHPSDDYLYICTSCKKRDFVD